jgi:hypothetical protein
MQRGQPFGGLVGVKIKRFEQVLGCGDMHKSSAAMRWWVDNEKPLPYPCLVGMCCRKTSQI